MPIPSRLAGIPEAIAWGLNRSRGNAAEQRAAERHAAWMQDRNRISPAEMRSQERHQAWQRNVAQEMAAQAEARKRQVAAESMLQGDMEGVMSRMGGKIGVTKVPYNVQNPDGTPQHQEMWDHGLDYGDTMTSRPKATIPRERFLTGQDKHDALEIYNTAKGTNMPSGSALARLLASGAEPDPADKPFVETRWNANPSEGGLPFRQKVRDAYGTMADDAITASLDSARAAPTGGIAGIFNEAQQHNIDDVRQVIMQDVWTVARRIARETNLIDEGTAFHQILDAMARGKISPIQISQMTGEDAVVGDSGGLAWVTPNKRSLQAAGTSREELRRMYEDEYGSIGQANALGLPPPN